MKTIQYPNKIRSHLVTIVPMAPFMHNHGFHNTFKYNHINYNNNYLLYTVIAHIMRVNEYW